MACSGFKPQTLHEPYKELKHEGGSDIGSVYPLVALHEPYKELKHGGSFSSKTRVAASSIIAWTL